MNIKLNELFLNNTGIIESIECCEKLKSRLFDLVFVLGTPITPLFRSISNVPTAYLVCNSIIAIRKNDSDNIFVSYSPNNHI